MSCRRPQKVQQQQGNEVPAMPLCRIPDAAHGLGCKRWQFCRWASFSALILELLFGSTVGTGFVHVSPQSLDSLI